VKEKKTPQPEKRFQNERIRRMAVALRLYEMLLVPVYLKQASTSRL
jgi:hypothetical protein